MRIFLLLVLSWRCWAQTNPKSISEISVPEGFSRVNLQPHDFGSWLRNLKLKSDKTVYLYDGSKKLIQTAQFAVVDIPVGTENLQQCADAVMRLRAQYLFDEQRFDEIQFFDFEKKLFQFGKPYTAENFEAFMMRVFKWCGSASLAKQLREKSFSKIGPGDVLIRAGFPGHAELVVDVAVSAEGKRIFLLAQSYMPAQNIHVLVNPKNPGLSPWYSAEFIKNIETPEYTFHRNELKQW